MREVFLSKTMTTLIENKWVILLCLEILAWLSTFLMLYARYGLKSKLWFLISSIAFAITGVIPQMILGIINYWFTKELDLFTFIIVLIIGYGMTIGKKQVKKLDKWAEAKFSRKKLNIKGLEVSLNPLSKCIGLLSEIQKFYYTEGETDEIRLRNGNLSLTFSKWSNGYF